MRPPGPQPSASPKEPATDPDPAHLSISERSRTTPVPPTSLPGTSLTPPASRQDILQGYRHLYRAALQAVQYARPARFTARDKLREAFRAPRATWDAEGARRTIWFLHAAAREKGVEHKVVKNLMRVAWERDHQRRNWKTQLQEGRKTYVKNDGIRNGGSWWTYADWRDDRKQELQSEDVYQHYQMTIAMMNHSLGTRLRC
jgi:hypothetical protein